jgi:hypothetical protein
MKGQKVYIFAAATHGRLCHLLTLATIDPQLLPAVESAGNMHPNASKNDDTLQRFIVYSKTIHLHWHLHIVVCKHWPEVAAHRIPVAIASLGVRRSDAAMRQVLLMRELFMPFNIVVEFVMATTNQISYSVYW